MSLAAPVPIVRIFDETRAREFDLGYRGFTLDWEHRFEPEPPRLVQTPDDRDPAVSPGADVPLLAPVP